MSDGPLARPTTRRRRPHSSHDKTATAGREKWAFDPESVGQARAARTRRADVARWATDALPAAVEREACGVVFREANGSACVVFAFAPNAQRGTRQRVSPKIEHLNVVNISLDDGALVKTQFERFLKAAKARKDSGGGGGEAKGAEYK